MSYTAGESSGLVNITVTRSASGTAVSVDYDTADGIGDPFTPPATAGLDYETASGTLMFAENETSKSFTITLKPDSLVEGAEKIDLTLTNATGGATLGRSMVPLFIEDDDSGGGSVQLLQFSALAYATNESKGAAKVTIKRQGGSRGTVSVTLESGDGTADASDYTPVVQAVSFAPGQTSKTITIPITNDGLPELDETIQLTLRNPAGNAAIGARNQATLTIFANDDSGTVQFGSPRFHVEEDAGTAEIIVSREGGLGTVSVAYATANGSAKAGADFTGVSGTLEFAEGEASKSFMVPITDDLTTEGNESLRLRLSSPTGTAKLGATREATLTIGFNDGIGVLQFAASIFRAKESPRRALITVQRSGGAVGTVTVRCTTSDATAEAGADYTATTGILTFGPGVKRRTFAVPILADPVPDGGESLRLTLSEPSGFATLGPRSEAMLLLAERNLVAKPLRVRPGQMLSLKGSFDSATPTFVTFNDFFGNETRVRALAVSSKLVRVRVPAFVDPMTFEPADREMAVLLEQAANVSGPALNIGVAALGDSGESAGTFTLEFLGQAHRLCEAAEEKWLVIETQSLGAVNTSALRADLQILQDKLLASSVQVEQLVAGSVADIPLGMIGTREVKLDADGLALLDRLLFAAVLDGRTSATGASTVQRLVRPRGGASLEPDPIGDFHDEFNPDLETTLKGLFQQFDKIAEIASGAVDKAAEFATDYVGVPDGIVEPAEDAAAATIYFATTFAPAVMGYAAVSMAEPFIELELGRAPDFATYQPALDHLYAGSSVFLKEQLESRLKEGVLEELDPDGELTDFVEEFTDICDRVHAALEPADTNSIVRQAFQNTQAIFENRPLPTVSIDDVTVTEPRRGTVNASFLITLSRTDLLPVTVRYSTIPGSAASGDFVQKSGSITIPAGVLGKFVSVPVKSDAITESTETFFMTLTSADGAVLGDDSGTGTILDSRLQWSVAGSFSVNGNAVSLAETFALPRSGGARNFPLGNGASVRVAFTASTVTVSGSGFGSEEGVTCNGSGSGSSSILESETGFSASGPISGSVRCFFDDGSSEDFPVTGSFTATAPK